MQVEWDPAKAASNLRKHGVDFADAVIALEDEYALTIEDHGHDEQRFKTLGLGPNMIVFLWFMPNVMRTQFESFRPGKQISPKPNSITEV
jgi:uncharacterized DUF497 family protein